jgi:hypothetical protein
VPIGEPREHGMSHAQAKILVLDRQPIAARLAIPLQRG